MRWGQRRLWCELNDLFGDVRYFGYDSIPIDTSISLLREVKNVVVRFEYM